MRDSRICSPELLSLTHAIAAAALCLQSIFAGPNGEKAREILVLKADCEDFYETFRQTATARAAALVLPKWLSQTQLSLGQVDAVSQAVTSAGTWDEVELHGGASHTGDFVCIDGFRLQPSFGRGDVGQITCTHTRSSLLGTGYAALGYEPTVLVQAWARPGATAAAAGAAVEGGEGAAAAVAAASSWISAAVGGVGAAPAASARLALNAKLHFRPAGQRQDVLFDLNEVESITLSVPLARPTQAARRRSRARSPSGSPAPQARKRPSRSPGPAAAAGGGSAGDGDAVDDWELIE